MFCLFSNVAREKRMEDQALRPVCYSAPQHRDSITFKVGLFCTHTKKTEHKTISFPESNRPDTIAKIKEEVEQNFSIPACVQTLSYDSYPLKDDTTLERMRIRSGDTFHIAYSAKGDCKEIKMTTKWFEQIKDFLLTKDPTLSNMRLDNHFDDLLTVGIRDKIIENMAFEYLFPWLNPAKYVNKLYFVSCGGLKIVMDVYAALLRHPWNDSLLKLKYVQYGILRILWNLSETFELRRLIVAHNNGLQLCIQSLLQEKLVVGEYIVDRTHRENSWVLIENIGAALGLLCNLSELPEFHLEIACNNDCLEQLTCISLTPSVSIMSVQLVATLFQCVAYTPQTHAHLAKPLLVERLLKACTKDRTFSSDDEIKDTLMVKYFTQVFLAQIILVSPQHVPEDYQQKIYDFMDDFLQTATCQAIMEGEVKQWYVWSTFIPYTKLVYLPPCCQLTELMEKLRMLSLQSILLSLQNMLGRDNHREVLLQEGLVDYITCIPSHVPESLNAEAKKLVQIVGSGLQLQPPKLVNLVKAKLAKMHFGLECVMNTTVGDLISSLQLK